MDPCDHKFVTDTIAVHVCRICGEAEVFLRIKEMQRQQQKMLDWERELLGRNMKLGHRILDLTAKIRELEKLP